MDPGLGWVYMLLQDNINIVLPPHSLHQDSPSETEDQPLASCKQEEKKNYRIVDRLPPHANTHKGQKQKPRSSKLLEVRLIRLSNSISNKQYLILVDSIIQNIIFGTLL